MLAFVTVYIIDRRRILYGSRAGQKLPPPSWRCGGGGKGLPATPTDVYFIAVLASASRIAKAWRRSPGESRCSLSINSETSF